MVYTIRKWPNPIRFLFKQIKKMVTKPSGNIAEYVHLSGIIDCMQKQLTNCEDVTNVLSKSALGNVLENKQKYSNYAIGCLFTIVSAIEYICTGRSSIEEYKEADMEGHGWIPEKK